MYGHHVVSKPKITSVPQASRGRAGSRSSDSADDIGHGGKLASATVHRRFQVLAQARKAPTKPRSGQSRPSLSKHRYALADSQPSYKTDTLPAASSRVGCIVQANSPPTGLCV
eukprot:81324-Chlamydomonas_euryale.AAC.3